MMINVTREDTAAGTSGSYVLPRYLVRLSFPHFLGLINVTNSSCFRLHFNWSKPQAAATHNLVLSPHSTTGVGQSALTTKRRGREQSCVRNHARSCILSFNTALILQLYSLSPGYIYIYSHVSL
jgi:hypothetical protein